MTGAPGRIPVRVNGETRAVPAGTTILDLLAELDLPAATVAVERNREILPKPRYGDTVLGPEDSLEIVRFVGGG